MSLGSNYNACIALRNVPKTLPKNKNIVRNSHRRIEIKVFDYISSIYFSLGRNIINQCPMADKDTRAHLSEEHATLSPLGGKIKLNFYRCMGTTEKLHENFSHGLCFISIKCHEM